MADIPSYILLAGFLLAVFVAYISPGLLAHYFISSRFKRKDLKLGLVTAAVLSVLLFLIGVVLFFAFVLHFSKYGFSLGLFLFCYIGLILSSALSLYFANYLVEKAKMK